MAHHGAGRKNLSRNDTLVTMVKIPLQGGSLTRDINLGTTYHQLSDDDEEEEDDDTFDRLGKQGACKLSSLLPYRMQLVLAVECVYIRISDSIFRQWSPHAPALTYPVRDQDQDQVYPFL